MKQRTLLALIFALLIPFGAANAQHWKTVFKAPGTVGSTMFFFNANEGFAGTGQYGPGYRATIFITSNGGKTWREAQLPNMNVSGSVTDIYFKDKLHGWATIVENQQNGWGGLYRSTDGGNSWVFTYPTEFAIAVRETKNGLFMSDRSFGIMRSTDSGESFTLAGPYGTLGLDFLGNQGYATSSGRALEQPYYTTDGGLNWTVVPSPMEAWSVYADPASGKFFYSAERHSDPSISRSEIAQSTDGGKTWKVVQQFGNDVLSGGIAGAKGCLPIVYVQGHLKNSQGIGLLRTTDAGFSWKNVATDNYNTFNDVRFSVTGRGAVVYIWSGDTLVKTSDGGDGTLSPSILSSVIIDDHLFSSTPVCDSISVDLSVIYNGCDSLRVVRAEVLQSSHSNEIALRSNLNTLPWSRSGSPAKVNFVYRPTTIGLSSVNIRFTLRQPDGYEEDTVLPINLRSVEPRVAFGITEETSTDKIDFGTRSFCADDSLREVTLTNLICAPLQIDNLSITGSAFSLISSFRPLTLDGGQSRTYLVRFKPTALGGNSGMLTVKSGSITQTVSLFGTGAPGQRGLRLTQPAITATPCAPAKYTVVIRNTSCDPITITSATTLPPFSVDQTVFPTTIQSGVDFPIQATYSPTTTGPQQQNLVIKWNTQGNPFPDTTIVLSGTGESGNPDLAPNPQVIDFGDVTSCAALQQTLYITASGCGTIDIQNSSLLDPNQGFAVLRQSQPSIPQGQTDSVWIGFNPTGFGSHQTTLTVQTNIGNRTVVVKGNVIGDTKGYGIAATQNIQIPKCLTSNLNIVFDNTTCDDLTIQSITPAPPNSGDFNFPANPNQPIVKGNQATVAGMFTPTGPGTRSQAYDIRLVRADNSTRDTSITVSADAIDAPPIRIGIPVASVTAAASKIIDIPVNVLDATVVDVDHIDVTLTGNTDLLSPTGSNPFDLSTGMLAGKATVTSFSEITGGKGVTFTVKLNAPQKLVPGMLGTLRLFAAVASELTTTIGVSASTITDPSGTNNCLSAQPLDHDLTTFTLDAACGDKVISKALGGTPLAVVLESVKPNPTSSSVTLKLRLSKEASETTELEVLDELGNMLQHESITTASGTQSVSYKLNFVGSAGSRYLRLTNSGTVITRRVVLER